MFCPAAWTDYFHNPPFFFGHGSISMFSLGLKKVSVFLGWGKSREEKAYSQLC